MVEFVSPFLSYNTYGLLVFTMEIKCPNQVFYVWLVDLQTICAKYGPETWSSPNDDIRKYLFMYHCWTKNALSEVNNKEWRKWCKFVSTFLLNNTYGLPVFTIDTNWTNQVVVAELADSYL
jgi:hypothetical protein